jgi:hypothetical protein
MTHTVTNILTKEMYGKIIRKYPDINAKKKFIKERLLELSKKSRNNKLLINISNVIDKINIDNKKFDENLLKILDNKDKSETLFRLLSIIAKHSGTLNPIFIELILDLCFNIINDNGSGEEIIYEDNNKGHKIMYGGGILSNIINAIGTGIGMGLDAITRPAMFFILLGVSSLMMLVALCSLITFNVETAKEMASSAGKAATLVFTTPLGELDKQLF